jgi:hypothetical protein
MTDALQHARLDGAREEKTHPHPAQTCDEARSPRRRNTIWLVPTRLIPAVWDEAAPLLAPAIAMAAGRHSLPSTLEQLRSGHMQLFFAVKEDVPVAAAVTQVLEYPSASWMVVLFCGGKGLPAWGRDGISAIEDWAKRCGCSGVEIIGRAGWAMALGYEKSASIIQKVLA